MEYYYVSNLPLGFNTVYTHTHTHTLILSTLDDGDAVYTYVFLAERTVLFQARVVA